MAFNLGSTQFVAPLGDIAEVLALPDVTPVPLAKSWMAGIANIRGRLLPIVNLSEFVGLPPSPVRSRDQKLLVIDQPKLFSGLVVDEVLGIPNLWSASLRAGSVVA